jgi:hypothetical protein
LDFQSTLEPAHKWELEATIKSAVQTLNAKHNNKINLVNAHRRRFAHQKWDELQAWDLTMACDSADAASSLARELRQELAAWNPMVGYHMCFAYFEKWHMPIVEFPHSSALLGLKNKAKLDWIYFAPPRWQ